MKKFWHSGMIDKKVIEKRQQDEHINKLHRTILELKHEEHPDMIDYMELIDWYIKHRKPYDNYMEN
ncbi:hypothetical protein PF616_01520 [Streptococcus thermophilus]|uniref:hypothetical protein n=1 Tax=Streptococcus thermophilus TaxID=1308 RepID=UPI0022EB7C04|nr:hypothetical protein [Streptococcus thermophilus]MDA3769156.1 hypothetical protein [Streptococcus thermophilus]